MLDKVTGRLKKCDSELEQVAKVGKLKKQEMWNKMAERQDQIQHRTMSHYWSQLPKILEQALSLYQLQSWRIALENHAALEEKEPHFHLP